MSHAFSAMQFNNAVSYVVVPTPSKQRYVVQAKSASQSALDVESACTAANSVAQSVPISLNPLVPSESFKLSPLPWNKFAVLLGASQTLVSKSV